MAIYFSPCIYLYTCNDGKLLNEVGHGMHQMHNCSPAKNLPVEAYKYDSEYPLTEFQIF